MHQNQSGFVFGSKTPPKNTRKIFGSWETYKIGEDRLYHFKNHFHDMNLRTKCPITLYIDRLLPDIFNLLCTTRAHQEVIQKHVSDSKVPLLLRLEKSRRKNFQIFWGSEEVHKKCRLKKWLYPQKWKFDAHYDYSIHLTYVIRSLFATFSGHLQQLFGCH